MKCILLGALVLFSVLSCKNPPPAPQELPVETAAFDRESSSPDQAALDDLDTAAARAAAARQRSIDIDCPSIFPQDWQAMDSLYTRTEQQKATSTLRETQESTARYNSIADAFEALGGKTHILSSEEREEKIAAVREAAAAAAEVAAAVEVATAVEVAAEAAATDSLPTEPPPQPPPQVQESPAIVIVAPPPRRPRAIRAIPVWTAAAANERSSALSPLPSQYTVRLWRTFNDTLVNIAARPWVYNDPAKWRILYNANKSRMPKPDNPNLINPGMVLDIPSIGGEFRQGMWDTNSSYPAFR